MNNEIQVFSFDSKEVITLTINDEPYFVGNDVAKILGYSNYRNATANHVDEEDKLRTRIEYAGQSREMTVINESGLYSLILSSKLPDVKKFKRWVTSEVLPAIRKHGAYLTDTKAEAIVTDKTALADLLQQAADQLKAKDVQIAEMRPKALFADSVAASDTNILVGDLAKILRGNGVDIGANRLFSWLRENKYLISRRGDSWNMPTQRAMDLGLFKIKEKTKYNPDNTVSIYRTTMVTGKGQQYFVNKFLGLGSAGQKF